MRQHTLAPSDVKSRLYKEHAELDAIFDEAVTAAEAGVDSTTLREIWQRFEQGLLEHMAMEEEVLFPRLRAKHPEEIAELEATHQWIRRRLDELGVDVELHLVRSHQVVELTERLRAHAEAENRGAYQWAQSEVAEQPADWFDDLVNRIGAGRGPNL